MMPNRVLLALAFCALCAYPARADQPTITVDASRVVGHITPWVTGSCIEDVNHEIYGGLYDQKIFGESFEEPPTPGGSVSGMWDPIQTGNAAAEFLWDSDYYVNGGHSQKIVHGVGVGRAGVANRGLNRWGIAVRMGARYVGRVYLRAASLQGPVTVALQSVDGAVTYASQTFHNIGVDWGKHAFALTSTATDPNARFAVWIDTPGTLWIDQAVLMDSDKPFPSERGGEERAGVGALPIRADIGNAIVDEGVTFLRYGGSMVNAPGYRWKNMIGDRDKRPPYQGTWYPYSTNGFGIFDFLNFCEAAHIDAAFAINIEETAQDAADLADYLTAPVTNPWGRRRADDGHPAPYRVHYIEIGNEESLGGDDPAAYRHYIERFRAIAHAIHGRNPSLKLVCAAWWRPDSPNVAAVFKAIDGQAAAWDVHVDADDPRSGVRVDRDLTVMQQRFLEWDPKTAMKAVIFEENGGRHDIQRALGHAGILNAVRRHGDFVMVDCPANCLQPWHENDNGWDQGQVFFTGDHTWRMPPYYAQQMASRNYEPLCVDSAVFGSAGLTVTGTRSVDGKTLVLSVVNVGDTPTTASISLDGFGPVTAAKAWTLSGDLDAVNPPDGPETTRSRESALSIRGASFAYTFPAHSYVVLRLSR